MVTAKQKRAGKVALIGRANVGKSSLLNRLLGQKLAIVSPKPHTTRHRLLGVYSDATTQIAFVDTPGAVGAGKKTRLHRFLQEELQQGLADVDLVVLLTNLERPRAKQAADSEEKPLLEAIRRAHVPALLAVNKVDIVRDKQELLPFIDAYQKRTDWKAIVPISARTGENVAELLREIQAALPAGDFLYPEEYLTDRSEKWLVTEMIREQVFLRVYEEIPYGVAVSIDVWEETTGPRGGRQVAVAATVHVAKDSHKKIIIGKGGVQLRDMGTAARKAIAEFLQARVRLDLFVRVDVAWPDSPRHLREFGYG